MQNTPTAHPTIRKKENNFRAEKVDVGWLLKLTSSLGKILYDPEFECTSSRYINNKIKDHHLKTVFKSPS